jgi:hypothetical protein
MIGRHKRTFGGRQWNVEITVGGRPVDPQRASDTNRNPGHPNLVLDIGGQGVGGDLGPAPGNLLRRNPLFCQQLPSAKECFGRVITGCGQAGRQGVAFVVSRREVLAGFFDRLITEDSLQNHSGMFVGNRHSFFLIEGADLPPFYGFAGD